MKNFLILPLVLLLLFFGNKYNKNNASSVLVTNTQSLINVESSIELQGAWTSSETNKSGEHITITTIVMDGYLAETFYPNRNSR